jgi:hypothetical protein
MNLTARTCCKLALGVIATLCCLTFSGCEGAYEAPITAGPTHKVDQRLLGDWISEDGTDKLKVRKLDDSVYVVAYNDDLYRAFHSDVGKTSFISLQDIDSTERKYAYLAYKLSDDGKRLELLVVSDKVIPKKTKDSASVQRLLKENLQNPELFGDKGQFAKKSN